jgi:hypothetical protein
VENMIYTVILDGEILKCIDTSSGMTMGTINITGELASGPIVTGNRCTVILKNYMGTQGKVYKLPSFDVVTTFSA